jgi:hypothetical protein
MENGLLRSVSLSRLHVLIFHIPLLTMHYSFHHM